MSRFRQVIDDRRQPAAVVGVIALALICAQLFSRGSTIPPAIYGVGLVTGSLLALHAIGLVVVYRANRIINFAQIQMSALGGLVFAGIVQRRLLLVGLHAICGPCLHGPSTVGGLRATGYGAALLREAGIAELPAATRLATLNDAFGRSLDAGRVAAAGAPRWLLGIEYVLAIVIALAIAVLLVWGLYALVVKRFNAAPKLVLTVLTLGAGQLARSVGGALLSPLVGRNPPVEALRPPVDLSIKVHPAVFSISDVAAVVCVVIAIALVTRFFRRSASGIALRASSENADRAQTLGIGVDAITGRAWIIAGLVGGVAGVVTVMHNGVDPGLGAGSLVRAVVAAVAGGLGGIPMAAVAAIGIGVMDQGILWASGSGALTEWVLLALVIAALVSQRSGITRAVDESSATWVASREIRPTPSVLRRLPPVRNGVRALIVVGGLIVLGWPWFMSPGQIGLAMSSMALAMVGLSLLVLVGWAGQISLGQMAFAAIGGWVAALGWPLPVALVAGVIAGAATATAVGLPALRLRGLHLAVTSLVFGAAVSAILLDNRYLGGLVQPSLKRPLLLGIDLNDDRVFYYVTFAFLVLAVLVVLGLRRSRTARALIACRDNERAAQSFGIDLVRARLSAFAISGALAAAAGCLLVEVQRGFQADAFGGARSTDMFLMTVIGGLGSVAGPLLGATYFGALSLLQGTAFGVLAGVLLSPGIGVVVLLLIAPGGLNGLVFDMRDAWLRRIASRRRIAVPTLATAQEGDGLIVLEPLDQQARTPRTYRPPTQWQIDSLTASGGSRG